MGESSISPSLTRPARFARIVHAAAALLLIAAALLKAYQTVARPDVVTISSRLLAGALIEFELALAGTLLLQLWPRAAWGLAITSFTVFAGVSVGRSINGVSSCGCFGPINIDPRITAGLDVLMVALLMLAGPQ